MDGSDGKAQGAKQKLAHELRQLVIIFLYLAGFFMIFRLYTRLVLAEYQINYFAYGLTLLKSLALAKIILTGKPSASARASRGFLLHFPRRSQIRARFKLSVAWVGLALAIVRPLPRPSLRWVKQTAKWRLQGTRVQ